MMKKYLFIAFSLMLFVGKISCAGNNSNEIIEDKNTPLQKGYSVKFKVKDVKDTTISLGYYYGDKQYLKDSARVDAQGRFEFKGENRLDPGIYIVIMPDKNYFELIMDKEQHFSVETEGPKYIDNMKIKGSNDNILFYEYLNFINPKGKEAEKIRKSYEGASAKDSVEIKAKLEKIDKEVNDYKKNFKEKNPNSFVTVIFKAMDEPNVPEVAKGEDGKDDPVAKFRAYKKHYWDNIDFNDDRIIRTPIYHNKLERYMSQLTVQIPDSINATADIIVEKAAASKELFKYTVFWITNNFERSKIMGMDAVFVHMAENYYMTNRAFWVDSAQNARIAERAMQLKPILLGKVAPDLFLRDKNNKVLSLHNMKSEYTILYFWDPDCGHCKKVTPKLNDLYLKTKDKGVNVYAVSIDPDLEKINKFVEEKKIAFTNVYDPYRQFNFKNLYDIYSTPVVYVLDKDKKILAKRLDVEQIEEFLEHQMKLKEEKK
jgi:peroxiredoxin